MSWPLVFTVEVGYTDRTRQADGQFNVYRTDVHVLADTDVEAALVASQMVCAIRDPTIDGMVVSTRITNVVA